MTDKELLAKVEFLGNETTNVIAEDIEELCDAVHARISELSKKTRWISVDEELPHTYDQVLLNCGGELLSTGFLQSDNSFSIDAEDPSDGSAWAVTHWMPLPEAPQ